MLEIACTNCGRPYPPDGNPFRCPSCGGVYDFEKLPVYDRIKIDHSQPGIWPYRYLFGLSWDAESISLGEGNTPVIWGKAFNRDVTFKCEFMNPTGSFKDRGSSILVSYLRTRGVIVAIEDSSGNAGASFAAYAARAGIRARIYVPEKTVGAKCKQIEAYGAELLRIQGSRSEVTEAVIQEAERGLAYASHAYLPFNIPGYATAAYEIYEQLGQMPGAVVLPVGQGGFLLGIWRGFRAIRDAGFSKEIPRIIGVQARACAPLWALFTAGRKGLGFVADNPTIAEGVRTLHPLRGDILLRAITESGGAMCAVDEDAILEGQTELARLGLFVESTSAIVWDGLAQTISSLPDPIVIILTGSGYKSL